MNRHSECSFHILKIERGVWLVFYTCNMLRIFLISPLEMASNALIPSGEASTLQQLLVKQPRIASGAGCGMWWMAWRKCAHDRWLLRARAHSSPPSHTHTCTHTTLYICKSYPSCLITCSKRGMTIVSWRGPKRNLVHRDCKAGIILFT